MKDTVTNRDLYTQILKVHEKIDTVVEKRITPLERTVDKLWFYASIGGTITSLVMLTIFEWVKEKFIKV